MSLPEFLRTTKPLLFSLYWPPCQPGCPVWWSWGPGWYGLSLLHLPTYSLTRCFARTRGCTDILPHRSCTTLLAGQHPVPEGRVRSLP